MARQESDKENLLREATALVERVELQPTSAQEREHVIAGFRHDGAASIFFGADPVYHFNAAGELRRAYCDGLLFKAVRGRLVSLRRERQQNEVHLLRRDLTEAEQIAFLARLRVLLIDLSIALNDATYVLVGQVPVDADVVGRLKKWLAQHDGSKIATAPNAERSN